MRVTNEQAMAYTEVIEVLKYMPKEETNKIPQKIIQYYKDNRDTSYEFNIDTDKSFDEQILLEKTKIVLAILYRDYWATEKQRARIIQKEKYDLEKLEMEKREKYNGDNLFKQKQVSLKENTKALVEYKEEIWYNKFINFLKKFLRIKK